MAILALTEFAGKPLNLGLLSLGILFTGLLWRIFYMQKLHPLAKFHGPWYATSFSIVGAMISVLRKEPEWIAHLEKVYGTEQPIRVSPYLLLFCRPSALKDIYRDNQLNRKGGIYQSGALGPPNLVTIADGEEHRALRKALSNGPWTIGPLKNAWESRFDELVTLFITKLHEHAEAKRTICLSDKMTEFAVDILSMISFSEPFGSVKNQRDEREFIRNFRKGLPMLGLGRTRFLREHIMSLPLMAKLFLPSTTDEAGMGWLMGEAERQIAAREKLIAEEKFQGKPDFLQHITSCLEARFSNGSPLAPVQKLSQVTLLILAGADTTGTAMGVTLQYMLSNPSVLARAREEMEAADSKGLLSTPIRYDEMKQHLPYFGACIKESFRLGPPAVNLFAREVPEGGKVIDGHFVPGGVEVTCYAYTIHRNKEFYGEDADEFKPERWLESQQRNFEMEAVNFTFGIGPRVCLGKDVAILESHKLLPEIIRRFDFDIKQLGKYQAVGGVASLQGLMVKPKSRA
ncbi:cytochrome P450 monooxygenase-like protein [Bipolaris maydis]|nr:cytochrome P450 monooxygenase-like protein [Bipolaris maydis]